ncbi:MAG: OprO/OprP family phosphate-selective porin [Planctomycetota bacterium]
MFRFSMRYSLFGLVLVAFLQGPSHAQVLAPAGGRLTDQAVQNGNSSGSNQEWTQPPTPSGDSWQNLSQSAPRGVSAMPASTSGNPLIEAASSYQPTNLALEEAKAPAAEDPFKMSAKWNNGLEVQTADKQFRVHVGGRYQLDTGWFGTPLNVNQNINVPYGDGIDFRRARLRVDGTMFEFIDWAAEFDFVNSVRIRNQPVTGVNPGFFDESVTAPTDLWVQYKTERKAKIRVGNQKEAIGFEHLVSSRFLPFMERSFNQDTFYGGVFNGFTPGIQVTRNWGYDDLGVLQYGVFKPVNSVFAFNTGDGDYSLVARITRLLQYCDDGRYLTHAGFSVRQATAVSQAGVPGRIQTFRTRDAVRTGLSQDWPVVNGINLFGDDMQWLNSEFVMVRGPWTLQSEYLFSFFNDARTALGNPLGNTVQYNGGYVQVLRYLTDDYDHYSKETGVFERVKPSHPFSRKGDCGWGAWQLGVRYNYLDLNDSGLNGGLAHNGTVGLNWFLNPNLKFQWNYMATYRDVDLVPAFAAGSGVVHGFGMRMAIDF